MRYFGYLFIRYRPDVLDVVDLDLSFMWPMDHFYSDSVLIAFGSEYPCPVHYDACGPVL